MKFAAMLLCTVISMPAHALNKCIEDGKVLFKKGPCPLLDQKRYVNPGPISIVETSGLRSQAAIHEVQERQALEKQKCDELMSMALDTGGGSIGAMVEAKRSSHAAVELYKSSCGQ